VNENLKREVAAKFQEALQRHGLTKTQAALSLGISRQMLHQYLTGKALPNSATLSRACHAWGISLSYKGLEFDQRAFRPLGAHPLREVPVQLSLFDALDSLRDGNLDVKVLRKSKAGLELRVCIKFAS
jgi:transcriptional regulator with XRE-family HTH domain